MLSNRKMINTMGMAHYKNSENKDISCSAFHDLFRDAIFISCKLVEMSKKIEIVKLRFEARQKDNSYLFILGGAAPHFEPVAGYGYLGLKITKKLFNFSVFLLIYWFEDKFLCLKLKIANH